MKIQSINAAIARAKLNKKNAVTTTEKQKWDFHITQLKKINLKKIAHRPKLKKEVTK